jgi:hypothetical protein
MFFVAPNCYNSTGNGTADGNSTALYCNGTDNGMANGALLGAMGMGMSVGVGCVVS